jgi:hypothetical protein
MAFTLLKNWKKGSTKIIAGYIGYFELDDWWLNNFLEDERKHMVDIFQPMGAPKDILITGQIGKPISEQGKSNDTPLSFLTTLVGWFDNPKDRVLAHKIVTKAEEYINTDGYILNLHFFYSTKMKLFYKSRDTNPQALQIAIESCENQISIAEKVGEVFRKMWGEPIPTHEGYEQLCIIFEKQKKFEQVIEIAGHAKRQGWSGDWDKRIERCHKKLSI